MQCPKCRTKLKEYKVAQGNVTVSACVDCKGVWFDGGELEAVLTEAAARLEVPEDAWPTTFSCARCRRRLFSFPYPGTRVLVDMCRACRGIWLDAGELKEIRTLLSAQKHFGQLHDDAPSPVKDALLNFINRAIDALTRG